MRRLEYYLKHCNWNAVRAELIRLMPEYEVQLNLIRAFKQAFYELKKTQPVPADTLFIHVYKDNVWAYLNESKYENNYLNEIDFEPWRNCLGMFVIVRSQESMSPAEIVASCLWTMTCHGFSQKQINKKLKSWGLETVRNGKVENYD